MNSLSDQAAKHISDIIQLAIRHDAGTQSALVVFDTRSPLALLLADAYRVALPDAEFLDFDTTTPAAILEKMDALKSHDLVILIQSMNFRLNEFRIRVELFKRGLAVIEHVYLERSSDEQQRQIYVDALAYDQDYYLTRGHAIKERIDQAKKITVTCAGTTLTYDTEMEDAKLNVGDYRETKNVGGTFPIGEVFSEPKDLTRVNGEAMIFAYAGTDHHTQIHTPFKIRIERGILVHHEGPPSFQEVLDQITSAEEILVREFGVGLNPAMGKHAYLADITAFERQKGLHFSLGEKHPIYKKPGLHQKKSQFHIDIFVDFQRIEADGQDLLRP